MNKVTAICIFAFLPSCSTAGDSFEQASAIAYEIIGAQASSPMCQPGLVSPLQRQHLVKALKSVTSEGLSDPAGLTPLDFAVIADDVPTIERFVDVGYALSARDGHGGTLLHGAALAGSKHTLSFLFNQGLDLNATNDSGATPLMVAVSHNRPEITQALLSAGASADARDKAGATALHYALPCRDQALISALLAAGAPLDSKAAILADKAGVSLPNGE